MKKTKKSTSWRIILLSLLFCVCPVIPEQARAQQTGQRTGDKIPGVPDGYTIVEGDIQMPIAVVNAMRSQAQLKPNAPQASFNIKLWPNGLVPYRFEDFCAATSTCSGALPSGCVSAANQIAMRNAMDLIEAAANVRFRRCVNNDCRGGDHILIRDSTNDTTAGPNNACQNASGNSSAVGRQGDRQILNIVSWTGTGSQFVIVHELMHALGFFHEHQRPDRDTYVNVIAFCNNVQGGCMGGTYTSNFPTKDGALIYGYYDFDSVMHYGQCAFSRNTNCPTASPVFPDGGITIQVKAPYNTQTSPGGVAWPLAIGQLTHLSYLDRITLSFLYPRGDFRFVDASINLPPPFRQNGSFGLPYQNLSTGVTATPGGGTLWIQPGTYTDARLFNKQMNLRAPLGGVIINPRQGAFNSTLAAVSAASYNGELAVESIAAAFGANLAAGTAVATSLPLPTTLAGATVKVKDAAGVERDAPLFFVSPSQINYQIPAGTSVGVAGVAVYNGNNIAAAGEIPVVTASPGLFSANASGQGLPAAVLLRARGEAQTIEQVARFDQTQNGFVPVPIDLGPEGDQVFLILFGTGFRAPDLSSGVTISIGGEESEVLYAGPAPGFAGLDQANVRVPRSLAGKGLVSILLTADNRAANAVTVNVR